MKAEAKSTGSRQNIAQTLDDIYRQQNRLFEIAAMCEGVIAMAEQNAESPDERTAQYLIRLAYVVQDAVTGVGSRLDEIQIAARAREAGADR